MWIWGLPYKVAEGRVFLNENSPKNSQLLERIQTEPLLSHVRQEGKEHWGALGPCGSSPARGGPHVPQAAKEGRSSAGVPGTGDLSARRRASPPPAAATPHPWAPGGGMPRRSVHDLW